MKEGSQWGTEGQREGSGDGNVPYIVCIPVNTLFAMLYYGLARWRHWGHWVKGAWDHSVPFLTITQKVAMILKSKV